MSMVAVELARAPLHLACALAMRRGHSGMLGRKQTTTSQVKAPDGNVEAKTKVA
jgi:hypothetical protein